ncbi:hypothetical protein BT93_J1685 [Corymbia citriodora subsp. variegata]|nr:hypothetical protein BT93_J1685 [Corymbia citriodora subsp. variegata]
MGLWSLINYRDLWKDRGLRSLVLFSLFLQSTLAPLASWRKSIFRYWIQVVVWTTYLSADSIATLTLGIMPNRLPQIKETEGICASQIVAFWAPFLLLHLGGPDTVTAYALADNELWLRQLARLCVQVGLACYVYYLALWRSKLWILAAGMILVGFIKYVEKTLCLYLASQGRLQGSMHSQPNFGSIYPRNVARYTLKKEEGYRVGIGELIQIPALEDPSAEGHQATPDKAYELFKIFKLLFVGLAVSSVDLGVSRRMFMDRNMKAVKAFEIVEIELGFMYDLLYTKALLLNRAWGIIRWVISLSVPCAVLVSFSLQDKKCYGKVDICITFLLLSVTILLEMFSLILAISSDWFRQWQLQRPTGSAISSSIAFLSFGRSPRWSRWSNSVAQFSLLGSSMRKRNSIFRYPRLAMLGEVVEKNFHIEYEELKVEIKELIFNHMRDVATKMEKRGGLKSALASLKLEMSELLKTSNWDNLKWSLDEMEFDQSIIIWHIATELCHYEDCRSVKSEEVTDYMMSMLVSRYMLYLLIFHPSMCATTMGVLRYQDTLFEAQKFFEDERAMLRKKERSISSGVIVWAQRLFKKEENAHTPLCNCFEEHESRESRDLCEVCHLLLQVRADFPAWKMSGVEGKSVLFDACHLARQLKSVETWIVISKVWARMMMYAACQCRGYQHSESLSRGGELLSHVWLLMAHLGVAEPVQTSGVPPHITKFIKK